MVTSGGAGFRSPPVPSWKHVSPPYPPSLSPLLLFVLAIDASWAASSSRLRPDKRAGREVLDQGVPRHAQHGGQGNEDHQRHAQAVGEPYPTVGRLGQDATRQVSPGCALRRAKGGEKEREAACHGRQPYCRWVDGVFGARIDALVGKEALLYS